MNMIKKIEEKALNQIPLTDGETQFILRSSDDLLMDVVAAARRVREKNFGKKVKLNFLVNIKSGLCSEDCHYCSQSKGSTAKIEKYRLQSFEEIADQVQRGLDVGASKACLVASGWGPNESELGQFCSSVKELKNRYPDLPICASMGFLNEEQAKQLKEAGVCTYNHNINTSPDYYQEICQTHTFNERLNTVQNVIQTGLMACSGVLLGMGEKEDDIVKMIHVLRGQQIHYIPINFLIPIEGATLRSPAPLSPARCLTYLAVFRLNFPNKEIRIAGGREQHLKSLQPLGLMIANSIFIGDYLTTQGQHPDVDLAMIRDLGYEVERQVATAPLATPSV